MTKCEFCKEDKKELRIIYDIEPEDVDVDYKICEECLKIEAPNLVWKKLQKVKGLTSGKR